ncbi:MAG: ACP phosphodiesterase [Bacteroidota bacterium]
MNFLAHAYLTAHDEGLLVGGFLGDFVKGKHYAERFPDSISRGIYLHRQIDHFTDTHPQVLELLKLLYPTQGKYASVLLDMLFDHLLARDWAAYSESPLPGFVSRYYQQLERNLIHFSPTAVSVFYAMQKYDWLNAYVKPEGVRRALGGLSRRVNFENTLAKGWTDFEKHETELEKGFQSFFPIVKAFVKEQVS